MEPAALGCGRVQRGIRGARPACQPGQPVPTSAECADSTTGQELHGSRGMTEGQDTSLNNTRGQHWPCRHSGTQTPAGWGVLEVPEVPSQMGLDTCWWREHLAATCLRHFLSQLSILGVLDFSEIVKRVPGGPNSRLFSVSGHGAHKSIFSRLHLLPGSCVQTRQLARAQARSRCPRGLLAPGPRGHCVPLRRGISCASRCAFSQTLLAFEDLDSGGTLSGTLQVPSGGMRLMRFSWSDSGCVVLKEDHGESRSGHIGPRARGSAGPLPVSVTNDSALHRARPCSAHGKLRLREVGGPAQSHSLRNPQLRMCVLPEQPLLADRALGGG